MLHLRNRRPIFILYVLLARWHKQKRKFAHYLKNYFTSAGYFNQKVIEKKGARDVDIFTLALHHSNDAIYDAGCPAGTIALCCSLSVFFITAFILPRKFPPEKEMTQYRKQKKDRKISAGITDDVVTLTPSEIGDVDVIVALFLDQFRFESACWSEVLLWVVPNFLYLYIIAQLEHTVWRLVFNWINAICHLNSII